ncbi:MAG TPA: hypothetical protein VFT23_06050 [Burkholderiales bacterium]|nr:hypothetical protein [Burkholderiales bacterium]
MKAGVALLGDLSRVEDKHSVKKRTPIATGGLWFCWTVFIVAMALLVPKLHHLDVNIFAAFLLNLVFWGGAAFVAGWAYAKMRSKDDKRSGA